MGEALRVFFPPRPGTRGRRSPFDPEPEAVAETPPALTDRIESVPVPAIGTGRRRPLASGSPGSVATAGISEAQAADLAYLFEPVTAVRVGRQGPVREPVMAMGPERVAEAAEGWMITVIGF